ncbi:MAG TPA: hypothetical protein VL201_02260 [Patescibacteria group bacterium]|jgi:hypothetical protein|nr:hypothetical protein [Patescibacteria group bacterium]
MDAYNENFRIFAQHTYDIRLVIFKITNQQNTTKSIISRILTIFTCFTAYLLINRAIKKSGIAEFFAEHFVRGLVNGLSSIID